MDNFSIKDWQYNQNLEEHLISEDTDAEISPNDSFKIWNWLHRYLESPAEKAGLRMSIFEQEFPTATSFYYALQKHRLAKVDEEKLHEGANDHIENVEIVYIDPNGRFYGAYITRDDAEETALGSKRKIKISSHEEANNFIKSLGVKTELPEKYQTSELEKISNELKSKGIDADYGDYMDVS